MDLPGPAWVTACALASQLLGFPYGSSQQPPPKLNNLQGAQRHWPCPSLCLSVHPAGKFCLWGVSGYLHTHAGPLLQCNNNEQAADILSLFYQRG